jgi:uncharacterized protein
MKRILMTLVLATLAFPAAALELSDARASGAVGEKSDGYVTALKPEASALAAEVNAKRKAKYAEISKQNGQPVDVVAKLAYPQIVSGLPAGAKYQDSSGAWKTK